ncbi:MAG: trehalase family glycosidase [Ignavibacteria bacterium]|nr:trehalase family glycosidase [Ignavibacteria bacterium]
MKIAKYHFVFCILTVLINLPAELSAQIKLDQKTFKALEGTHDLSLPDWGPYTKRYIGVSHIPDKNKGLRFDVSVFPGLYRRKVIVPDVLFESDFHPWEASPNLEYFSFRHELEWKDQVYTDISYSEISSNARLIRINCVNNTENNQNLSLHFAASLHFPPIKEYTVDSPIYPGEVSLPEGVKWNRAIDYEDLRFAKPRPQDNLVYDGKMRGEIRENGFVSGSGVGAKFGLDKGDFGSYKIVIDQPLENAALFIRYKMEVGKEISFKATGLINKEISLKGNEGFSTEVINVGKLSAGNYNLTLTSNGGNAIELDGFVICEVSQVDQIQFNQKKWNYVPQIIDGPVKNSILLKYDDVDLYYGLLWQYDVFEIRQWNQRDLSDYFKRMVNEHVQKVFTGEGDGHYTNVFMRPVNLNPKSNKTIYGIVCCGSKEEVAKYLSEMNSSMDKYESIYEKAKQHVADITGNKEGEKYKFSIERMNATLATNVVYPVYTQKQFIRHSAPGRWWDCLYTWDSGFIGLGMLTTNTQRAIESLNAYTQEPGAQSAFIHHGSPVPVQHYLFLDLWNKTQSKELLKYFYPRLKQYHAFMAGRLGSSTTNVLKSNLLKTWDYFYNSGGWDDLPPQVYTHANKLESTVTPVITTSQVIRTAKILRMAAEYLGKKKDVKEFDNDIQKFSNALQKYSWDEDSGYFGYVVHDKDGNPSHILKYNNTVNYAMGFDGAYPLIAGVCTDAQKEKILSWIKSEKHIWSKAGLSAVDQSAPYYKIDGYWNGTVWMSHQWFFWKTMLDLGEAEFANKIAVTALDMWKKETETSYNCMEHFIIENGRGAGWHQFGALSSPVQLWYAAYYRPGNFTTGFDVWIQNKKFDEPYSNLSVELTFNGNNKISSVVACLNPDNEYEVKWNGEKLTYKTLSQGTLSINIPLDKVKKGKLEIHKK